MHLQTGVSFFIILRPEFGMRRGQILPPTRKEPFVELPVASSRGVRGHVVRFPVDEGAIRGFVGVRLLAREARQLLESQLKSLGTAHGLSHSSRTMSVLCWKGSSLRKALPSNPRGASRSSTPSTRRLLDSVAMPVPHGATEAHWLIPTQIVPSCSSSHLRSSLSHLR